MARKFQPVGTDLLASQKVLQGSVTGSQGVEATSTRGSALEALLNKDVELVT